MKKTPMKGEVDFSGFDDEKLKECREVITGLIGAYSEFSDKVLVLKEIWKNLSDECIDRLYVEEKEVKPLLVHAKFNKLRRTRLTK